MDFVGVSHIEPKYRNVPVSGKYVKKIRSYLDPTSKNLRVVLDMEPSRFYIIQPAQDQKANAYALIISEKRRGKSKYAKRYDVADAKDERAPLPFPSVATQIDRPPQPSVSPAATVNSSSQQLPVTTQAASASDASFRSAAYRGVICPPRLKKRLFESFAEGQQ